MRVFCCLSAGSHLAFSLSAHVHTPLQWLKLIQVVLQHEVIKLKKNSMNRQVSKLTWEHRLTICLACSPNSLTMSHFCPIMSLSCSAFLLCEVSVESRSLACSSFSSSFLTSPSHLSSSVLILRRRYVKHCSSGTDYSVLDLPWVALPLQHATSSDRDLDWPGNNESATFKVYPLFWGLFFWQENFWSESTAK